MAAQPYIDVHEVGLTLAGNSIYESLSLAIPESKFFFLLGPSGCGKSTLLRLIAGLIEPSTGALRVDGEPAQDAWQKSAFIFQSPRLAGWRTAIDNVALAGQLRFGGSARKYRERAAELLTSLGLGNDLHKTPAMLSGGERQRVAIARAFLLDPPIILMDEPFSALDLKTRELLRHELAELWRLYKKTVVFVTHDIDDALSLADRIAVLGPKPTRVLDIMDIDQPRPRNLASPVSQTLRGRLEQLLTQ
ncbi:ABC transporter ATP-binding protein [Pusillimonas sp.]|uniref:ABC transporter ATP-binding protein n=1 Tax=Pusillimonas sp. TaxID=3040095 RepID=UPI0037C62434